MSLVAQFMPVFSLREVQHIAVEADPELAYLRLRAVDLNEVHIVRRLLRLHSLPKRARAWWHGYRRARPNSARIDDLVGSVPGLCMLGERHGEEVVVGAIVEPGTGWLSASQRVKSAQPSMFCSFAAPGFAKLALALRVTPRTFGGSWITIELRAVSTDSEAEARLKRAWHAVGRLAAAISARLMRRLEADLGPLVESEALRLPGDAYLQGASFQMTHAMTLEAAPQQVWSWLLDTLAVPVSGVPGARGQPTIGERMPGLLELTGNLVVMRTEPARVLILGDASLNMRGTRDPDAGASRSSTTWAFVLTPIGDAATRLIVRVRSRWEHKLGTAVLSPLVLAMHDAFDRRLLSSLSRQAESFDWHTAA